MSEFEISNPDNTPLYVDTLSSEFIKDGELSFRKDVCSWCGEEHNDITFTVEPPLTVCVSCIIKALDKALGDHSLSETKIEEGDE